MPSWSSATTAPSSSPPLGLRGRQPRQAGAARGGGAGGTGGQGAKEPLERPAAPRRHSDHRAVSAAQDPADAAQGLSEAAALSDRGSDRAAAGAAGGRHARSGAAGPALSGGDVETLPLFKDGFQLVARKDNPLAQKKTADPADLKDADLLLLADGHCLRDHALAACRLPRPTAALPAPASTPWWKWWPAASASPCCRTWRWQCMCRRPANWWRGRSIVLGLGVRSDWRGARRQVGPRNSGSSARP